MRPALAQIRLLPCWRARLLYACTAAAWILLSAAGAWSAELTLRQAVARALKFVPTVDTAMAQRELSAALVDAARAPLLPNLGYDTEYYQAPGYSKTITNGGQSDTMLVLNYTVYDGGLRMAQLHAARFAQQAATLGLDAARAQVVFDTSVAYYNLLQARHIEAETQASLGRIGQYVRIITVLRGEGRAISSDVLKLQSARDTANLALLQARAARERASAMLGSMIGEFDNIDLPIADVTTPPALPTGDIANNPAVLAAQRNIAGAAQAVKAAQAEAYPTFSMQLTSGFLGINPPDTVKENLGASYEGLITVPVFTGGLIRSHIEQARASEHVARSQERQVEFSLRQRFADAALRYRQANEQLQSLAQAIPTANATFAMYWTRFLGGGTATLLEVLDAYNLAEQMRISRIQQLYAMQAASAECKFLVGSGQ